MEERDVREKSEGNTNNYKKLKCTLTILVAVAIVNMSVLLPLVVHLHLSRQNRVESEWCSVLDVTSQGNPDLLGQLIVKTDKNTDRNKTCGKLSTMLKTVVNLNIHDSYDSDACPEPEMLALGIKAFNCTASKKVESTLHLDDISSHAKPVPGKNTKVYWSRFTDMIIHHMKYIQEEGVIYIKQSGYYFVSSLLTVRANSMTSTDTVNNSEVAIRHVVNVLHHKDGAKQVLLEHVNSMCELSFGYAEWSSNIGAPFYLNKQDRVYVATSHPYNIVSGHSKNYLSIHTIL
ncbi:uncharacterized protein LOC132754719 isoform X1 [Ruditapes philippinarum]|uniref:uncharacterized protein LOC132754719 isoform X1 n=1 Tax=Ruditapes philippinarum TaxID=129788 RepID=UPI00295C2BBE|nr:uncharacterized protein LOC132754719 isoform X1 [Ruditapes philippinarum]